jgi:hypothetical protein
MATMEVNGTIYPLSCHSTRSYDSEGFLAEPRREDECSWQIANPGDHITFTTEEPATLIQARN